jgi:putative copper export protein
MHAAAAVLDRPQLADWTTIVRLSLHILAACVWVGGQFVLAGLLPTVRGLGDTAPRKIAQAFARLSWPAFALLIVTGFWNYFAVNHDHAFTSWSVVFNVKMVCVVAAGVGTYLHTRAKTAKAKGAWAGIGTLASIAALVLGVALAG